jgi:YD repeat-containing protein
VQVGNDGRVYVSDTGNALLRMIDQQGIIRRIAGSTLADPGGNGGPPLSAALGTEVFRTAHGPEGSIYVTSRFDHTVRAIAPTIAGDFSGQPRVPSRDGTELYRFSAEGRHLDTTRASDGALLYSFGYDAAGRLTTVTDGAGQMTEIERDPEGNPTRIIAPSGEETLIDTVDGYASTFIGPTGEETELGYDEGGLLTRVIDASGVEHSYAYDADGRLLP